MKKMFFAFAAVLLCSPLIAQTKITMLYGPDNTILKSGKYCIVTVEINPTDPLADPVVTRQYFETGIGGDVPIPPPPPPPPPPPIEGFEEKVKAILNSVNDPEKNKTKNELSIVYDSNLRHVETGVIKDAETLKIYVQIGEAAVLANAGKTTQWLAWTTEIPKLTSEMDFNKLIAAYKVIKAQLGGGPIPPPPPPPPPPPVTTAVSAIILIESSSQTPEQAQMFNLMRNDQKWSNLIKIADPQLKDENNQLDKKIQELLQIKEVEDHQLPCIVLLNREGSFAGVVDLSKNFDELKKVLTEKGLKP